MSSTKPDDSSPLIAGLAPKWAVAAWAVLAWRRWSAARTWPAGVVVWLGTYVIGMVLRGLSGEGLAPAFLVVSLLFLGLTLVGWRGYVSAKLHYRSRRLAD